MLDDEIARQVVPVSQGETVRGGATAASPARGATGKAERAAQLTRRVVAPPPGRYMVIVTVDEGGPRDWSVQSLGKVEP